jgi:hypothetical protein
MDRPTCLSVRTSHSSRPGQGRRDDHDLLRGIDGERSPNRGRATWSFTDSLEMSRDVRNRAE